MAKYSMENETLEDVRIVFRNFSGAEGKYNREGDRNFAVLLSESDAETLRSRGWTIRALKPREEGEEPQPYISVKVKYSQKARPPKVVLVTSRGKNVLNESLINMLDFAEIEKADLIIRPYQWEVNGDTGVTAYLQSLYVTIREDDLDRKYADTPDTAAGPTPDDGPRFVGYDEDPVF